MKTLTVLTLFLTLIACKKQNLDNLAFPSEKLEEYQFEKYNTGAEKIPDIYQIDSKNRTLISMESKNEATGETYTIYGVYIGDLTTIPNDTIIMYCHGQAKHMDAYWDRASLLANIISKHHYGVFMMDYRGYGLSEGQSSESGLNEDVDASINWLKSMGAKSSNTFFYGFSLGCIPVIDRSAYRKDFAPAKIILESLLASVENLAQTSTIINIAPQFVTSLEFKNAEKIKDVEMPLLWIHGIEDDYIAIENGELIYNNYKGTYKEAKRIEDANHDNIPKIMGYSTYIKTLEKFIRND